MANAPSKTGIYNNAISRLGSTEFETSIDDSTRKTAVRACNLWDDLRRLLLSLHPFNFAIERHRLNESGEVPAFGWERAYRLPQGTLRWLPGTRENDEWFEGEREGDMILTDRAAPIAVRVIMDRPDVTTWSPAFVMAFTLALSEWLSFAVTESMGMTERMMDAAERAVRKAKRMDGLETGRRTRGAATIESTWLKARNRSFYGRPS